MKAIVRETYGPPDVLHLEDVPLPTVGDGDVLVRVRAASANAGDWHLLRGTPLPFRLVAGLRRPKVQDHRHRHRRPRRSRRPERHPVPSRGRSLRRTVPMRLRCVCGIRGRTGEGAGVETGQPVVRGSGGVTDRRLHGASRSSEGTDTTRAARAHQRRLRRRRNVRGPNCQELRSRGDRGLQHAERGRGALDWRRPRARLHERRFRERSANDTI